MLTPYNFCMANTARPNFGQIAFLVCACSAKGNWFHLHICSLLITTFHHDLRTFIGKPVFASSSATYFPLSQLLFHFAVSPPLTSNSIHGLLCRQSSRGSVGPGSQSSGTI